MPTTTLGLDAVTHPGELLALGHSGVRAPDRDRYHRGYRAPAPLRTLVGEAHRTALTRSVTTALRDLAAIVLASLAATGSVALGPAVAHPGTPGAPGLMMIVAVVAGAAVVIGRSLRGLECLVHEASHYNWARTRRRTNDVAATLLACWPTGASLAIYRASHLRHHGAFGTDEDPDRRRYEDLGIEDWDRSHVLGLWVGVASRSRAYLRGWATEVGRRGWLGVTGWGVAVAVPAVLAARGLGHPAAAWAGVAAWALGTFVALPAIRLIAESSEHRYRDAGTVAEATVSNLGRLQRLVFHPHADGYHTVHHLWPGIPHHRIARLHRALLSEDPGFAAVLWVRRGVRDTPARADGAA